MDSSCNLRSIYLIIFVNNLRLILLIGVGGSKVSVCEIKKKSEPHVYSPVWLWPRSMTNEQTEREVEQAERRFSLLHLFAPKSSSVSPIRLSRGGHRLWCSSGSAARKVERSQKGTKCRKISVVLENILCKWNTTSATSLISDGQK
jgi:hypothetical protein